MQSTHLLFSSMVTINIHPQGDVLALWLGRIAKDCLFFITIEQFLVIQFEDIHINSGLQGVISHPRVVIDS